MDKVTTQKTKKFRGFRLPRHWRLNAIHWLGIAIFMVVGLLGITYTQFLETTSSSLEGIRYLFVIKSDFIKRYDIVFIQGYSIQYVGEKPLVKRVIGLPGDRIIRNKTTLIVKHQLASFSITLPLLKKTKEEDSLSPLSFNIIPEGYFFVAGDHPRSFDSRYEEFGLVPIEKIWGKAVMTWQ